MFARVTVFQGAPDSVDGPIRFAVQRASERVEELTGFLGLLDLADRKSGHAVIVTLWATKEARDARTSRGTPPRTWLKKVMSK